MNPVTEEELKASAVAPRVTQEALEGNIKAHYCFNVLTVLKAYNDAKPENAMPLLEAELGVLTFCIIVLNNGFTVTGQNACADYRNYNPEIGNRLAFDDAKKKIWALMGYSLREDLYRNGANDFVERMNQEARELGDKLSKLQAFVGTDTYLRLTPEEQKLLAKQRVAMAEYHEVLLQRYYSNKDKK